MREDEPIRIAHILGKMCAGGVESVVFNYYREFDHNKVQFDFYYDSDSTVEPQLELIDMGARFIEIPPYQNLISYLKILRRCFKNNKYQIVHSHINTLSVFPLFVAWCEDIPIRIVHNHSVPGKYEFKRNILKYCLRCFAKVFATDYFACAEKTGRWMFGKKAFNDGKVMIVNNAIDFNKFRSDRDEIIEYRRQLGLEDKFVIGHVGRFTYAKNHAFLISVFREICKLRDDAILLLVGDGELHEQILEKLSKSNLKEKTVFTGIVSNPEIYYGLIDVMVMPSFYEGLPLTVIESQVSGTPIIISENIPDEAIISNGCMQLSLSDSIEKWVNATIAASERKYIIELNVNSELYNIEHAASKLEEWYLNRLNSINKKL